ncbi:MAG: GntR family transcriptional regulator [Clostridiales bacterium]|nr:GntR family transcriptional regulator [Clostridiales bacterium]
MERNEPLIQYTTVSDSVYFWIKNAIIQGDFKPGEHIAQERLTSMLGVSRTPVRDAMKRLEAEGLLITKPHCGAIVFQLSRGRLIEIYEIRILLEQYCIARTCIKASDRDIQEIENISLQMLNYTSSSKEFMRLDRQFHKLICTLSGCDDTVEILEGIWNKCDSFKSIYYSLAGRINETLSEHSRIVQGLKNRDIATTQQVISDHYKDVVNSVSAFASFAPEEN